MCWRPGQRWITRDLAGSPGGRAVAGATPAPARPGLRRPGAPAQEMPRPLEKSMGGRGPRGGRPDCPDGAQITRATRRLTRVTPPDRAPAAGAPLGHPPPQAGCTSPIKKSGAAPTLLRAPPAAARPPAPPGLPPPQPPVRCQQGALGGADAAFSPPPKPGPLLAGRWAARAARNRAGCRSP
jgi:hypothetical protein